MKILIAEDSRASRMLLERMLNKWGYEVVVTCDGNEAWQALQAEDAPPLAILDWMMPGMEGVEVCRKARQLDVPDPTYIILLTTHSRKEDIVTGLNAGANDYVAKPFDKEELLARTKVGERFVELQSALTKRIKSLQDAMAHIKRLQGILPICMYCHKIRNDQETWERIEEYITEHSEAQFSHGLCPECAKKYYSEYLPKKG